MQRTITSGCRYSCRALLRLSDTQLRARYDAGLKTIEHQEQLTRSQLHEKQQEFLRQAREGYVQQLTRQTRVAPDDLGPWMNVERLHFQVLLGTDLKQVAEECLEYLGPEPKQVDPAQVPLDAFQEVLLHRHLMMLANLAARRSAPPELAIRLLNYVDRAIVEIPDANGWRLFRYQLLVALDRTDDLQAELQRWSRRMTPW